MKAGKHSRETTIMSFSLVLTRTCGHVAKILNLSPLVCCDKGVVPRSQPA